MSSQQNDLSTYRLLRPRTYQSSHSSHYIDVPSRPGPLLYIQQLHPFIGAPGEVVPEPVLNVFWFPHRAPLQAEALLARCWADIPSKVNREPSIEWVLDERGYWGQDLRV